MSNEQAGDGAIQDAAADQATASPRVEPAGMGAAAGLVWGLIGGTAAWGLIVAFSPIFRLSDEFRSVNMYSPPPMIAARDAAASVADRQNNLATLAQLGALVGALLGLGDGLARRSALKALGGLCLVGLLGAAAAVAGCWLGQQAMDAYTAYYGEVGPDTELFRTILVHAVMLATMGAGVGLGLGVLRAHWGGLVSAIVAGVLAGCFAGMVYPFAAAKLLPQNVTENLLPDGDINRLLWIGLAAAFLGLTIPGMKLSRAAKPKAVPS